MLFKALMIKSIIEMCSYTVILSQKNKIELDSILHLHSKYEKVSTFHIKSLLPMQSLWGYMTGVP